MNTIRASHLLKVVLAMSFVGATVSVKAQEVDVAAAEALAKKSNCTKCHSVSAKKDGPAYKVTAEKFKGKADAEATLIKHLKTGPKIKIDGVEEEHQIVKSKDDAEIKNLVRYILSR